MTAEAQGRRRSPTTDEGRCWSELGEDPTREGLVRTPERVEKALRFLTSGYQTDLDKIVNGALFKVKYDEMVIVKDIEFFSMCEHHLLPFYGKMHVAYLPNGTCDRAEQDSAHRRYVRAPAADSGAADAADCARRMQEMLRSAGRGRDLRGAAFLHDDARRGETAFRYGDQRHAGGVPIGERNARRVLYR